jgi:hypothetical protein
MPEQYRNEIYNCKVTQKRRSLCYFESISPCSMRFMSAVCFHNRLVVIQHQVQYDFVSLGLLAKVHQAQTIPHSSAHTPLSLTPSSVPAWLFILPFTISAMILVFICSSASLLISLNTPSISSSVLPAVSGTQKNVNTNASRQNTAKNVYAPAPVFWIRGGVMRPCVR